MAHAQAIIDVHIVPVDCHHTDHNLLISNTLDVVLVLQQGTITFPGNHLSWQIALQGAGGTHVHRRPILWYDRCSVKEEAAR